MKIAYLGVDPGKSGFITGFDGDEFKFWAMPTHKVETGEFLKSGKPKMKTIFHEAGLKKMVVDIKQTYLDHDIRIWIEEVGGRGGWSATNNFNFGFTAGMLKVCMLLLSEENFMVRPQRWQSLMREGYKNIKKESSTGKTQINDSKAMAEYIVEQEYSHIDFRKTERATKNDDNKIDSFLICLYGYRIDVNYRSKSI